MPKRSRLHTRQQALRHNAKMMRLAQVYGMAEPWRTIWIKKASEKYSARAWCNVERHGCSIQERKLDLQDDQDGQEGEGT